MVDAGLRIRLEGRVEELEGALINWAGALRTAKLRQFTAAAQMLERGEVSLPHRDDRGLRKLLAKQGALKREVERVVADRLRLLGMPSIDLARGARWLESEPILYEHHRLTYVWLSRAVAASFFLCFPACLTRGLIVGQLLFLIPLAVAVRWFGWSDVVLTARRLNLEGQIIDLTNVARFVLVQPVMQAYPGSYDVELHLSSGWMNFARLRHAPQSLRYALIKLGLKVDAAAW
jgi:hypothetical protein